MIKKKTALLLSLFILIGSVAFGQKTNKDEAILWEVSGNGLSAPSYLLGTCHIVPYTYTDSIPGYKEAYASVQRVIIEHDIRPQAASVLTARIQKNMMLPADTTYAMLCNADELKELDQFLQANGMGKAEQLELRPSILSLFISIGKEMMKLQGREPMDLGVVTHGSADGKAIDFFETGDEAWSIMEYLIFGKDLKEQTQELLKVFRETDKLKKKMTALIEHYKEQKISSLFEDQEMTPQDIEHLLNRRNANWIKKIPAFLQEKPTLIAVGAGHLIGKKGLIQELKAMGYKVRAISL